MTSPEAIAKTNSRINMLILVIIAVVTLVIETTIARLYAFFSSGVDVLQLNFCLFAGGIFLYSIVHFLMLSDIKKKIDTVTIRRSKRLHFTYFITMIVQSVLSIILFVVLYQTLVTMSYSTHLIIVAISISYSTGLVNLGILLERFVRWLVNIPSKIPLLFTLAISGIIINAIFTLVFVVGVLTTQPDNITWHQGSIVPIISGLNSILEKFYSTSYIISYLLAWVASVSILHNYSMKLGKLFWLFALMPLLYLLGNLQPIIMPLLNEYRSQDPTTFIIVYTLFFNLVKLAGAIFFGVGLWSIGKKIQNEKLKSFLRMSGYGLILLFVSNQAILLLGYLFPPLGLTTASFLGLSSFLLLAGTYSSALSIANDLDIRKSIRKSVEQEFKLVDNIGQAEMHINIRNRVFSKMRDLSLKLNEETGVESSLTLEEIKDYTTSAIEEIRRYRMSK